MYYLVQSNILSDPDHHRIFGALEDLGLSYEAFELQPDAHQIRAQVDRKDIFVYGSVKLARLAKANTDWSPGSFYGGNHAFEAYAQHYGPHLLNHPAQVHRFGEAQAWQPGERRFIKPYVAAKVFTGRVFAEAEWNDFVAENLDQPKTPLLHAETLVMASAPQRLVKEARIWIVGGQAIAGVYYRFHGDQPFEREVDPEGMAFARAMARMWEAAPAFVMDIGLCEDGWKIVELNCINSAGLYGLHPAHLLRALELYFSE